MRLEVVSTVIDVSFTKAFLLESNNRSVWMVKVDTSEKKWDLYLRLPDEQSVETKTIPASVSVYSYSSLPRLDSPPTNAHSTFQHNHACKPAKLVPFRPQLRTSDLNEFDDPHPVQTLVIHLNNHHRQVGLNQNDGRERD
jgi:hypothetical protein